MLLPAIIFSHDFNYKTDIKQREARDWLRRLENAVSMRTDILEKEGYVEGGVVDLDAVNRDLVECHSQVLWKRPKAYMDILDGMEKAMHRFYEKLPEEKKKNSVMRQLHSSMVSRMDFYRVKLQGIDSYAHTTLQRLEIQRSAVRLPVSLFFVLGETNFGCSFIILSLRRSRNSIFRWLASRGTFQSPPSKISSKLDSSQTKKTFFNHPTKHRKLAHASKRDSAAMKTISLLGAIFLPGAYLAAVFSMTFFNFNPDPNQPVISPQFWIYWAFTIPITTVIVGGWWFWERKRERKYGKEDQDLENGSEDMEKNIMAMMRRRTMSKASTWDTKRD